VAICAAASTAPPLGPVPSLPRRNLQRKAPRLCQRRHSPPAAGPEDRAADFETMRGGVARSRLLGRLAVSAGDASALPLDNNASAAAAAAAGRTGRCTSGE
jgi:hypothetical protein